MKRKVCSILLSLGYTAVLFFIIPDVIYVANKLNWSLLPFIFMLGYFAFTAFLTYATWQGLFPVGNPDNEEDR